MFFVDIFNFIGYAYTRSSPACEITLYQGNSKVEIQKLQNKIRKFEKESVIIVGNRAE